MKGVAVPAGERHPVAGNAGNAELPGGIDLPLGLAPARRGSGVGKLGIEGLAENNAQGLQQVGLGADGE